MLNKLCKISKFYVINLHKCNLDITKYKQKIIFLLLHKLWVKTNFLKCNGWISIEKLPLCESSLSYTLIFSIYQFCNVLVLQTCVLTRVQHESILWLWYTCTASNKFMINYAIIKNLHKNLKLESRIASIVRFKKPIFFS